MDWMMENINENEINIHAFRKSEAGSDEKLSASEMDVLTKRRNTEKSN